MAETAEVSGAIRCVQCFEMTDNTVETCIHCGASIPAYLLKPKPETEPEEQEPIQAEEAALVTEVERPSALDVALGKANPEPNSKEPIPEARTAVVDTTAPEVSALEVAVPKEAVPRAPLNPSMKLILRRDQKSGLTGTVTFILHLRVALSDDMAQLVKKYRLGKEVVYHKEKVAPGGRDHSWSDIARNLAAIALNLKITINDLVKGRTIECKDIVEMRAAEEQIKEACGVFKSILESARYFEGEEVIEI